MAFFCGFVTDLIEVYRISFLLKTGTSSPWIAALDPLLSASTVLASIIVNRFDVGHMPECALCLVTSLLLFYPCYPLFIAQEFFLTLWYLAASSSNGTLHYYVGSLFGLVLGAFFEVGLPLPQLIPFLQLMIVVAISFGFDQDQEQENRKEEQPQEGEKVEQAMAAQPSVCYLLISDAYLTYPNPIQLLLVVTVCTFMVCFVIHELQVRTLHIGIVYASALFAINWMGQIPPLYVSVMMNAILVSVYSLKPVRMFLVARFTSALAIVLIDNLPNQRTSALRVAFWVFVCSLVLSSITDGGSKVSNGRELRPPDDEVDEKRDQQQGQDA